MLESLFQTDDIAFDSAGHAESLLDGRDWNGLVTGDFLAEGDDLEQSLLCKFRGDVAEASVEQFLGVNFFIHQHQRTREECQVLHQQIHPVDFAGDDMPELSPELRIIVTLR